MNNEMIDDNSKTSITNTATTTVVDTKTSPNKPTTIKTEDQIGENTETKVEIIISKQLNNISEILDDVQQENLIEEIYSDIIDDVSFGLMLQVHRAARLGYLFYLDPDSDPDFEKQYDIYDDNDVLGVFSHLNENFKVSSNSRGNQGSGSNNGNLMKYECVCPNCSRNVAAIRFAPHLEKCMGMGRSSSRIATRRIANYNGDIELDQLIEATGMIPNHHRSNNSNSNSNNNDSSSYQIVNTAGIMNQNETNINASSSCSSMIDVDVSSNSSSCSASMSSSSQLKPRAAKKRKTQKNFSSTSNSIPQLPSSVNAQPTNNNGSTNKTAATVTLTPQTSTTNGSNLRTNSFY